jgi:predicted histone-like DNA-binding protein
MALRYEKKEVTLHFKEGQPTVYKVAPVKEQAIAYDKLLEDVARSAGVNKQITTMVVSSLIDSMVYMMDLGHPVKLGDFGSFKPTFNAKTSTTEEGATADTIIRKKILFYPGKSFKNMLADISVTNNGTTVSGDTETDEEEDATAGTTPSTGSSSTEGDGQTSDKDNTQQGSDGGFE